MQFDLLHPLNELDQNILVIGQFLEAVIVDLFAPAQKEKDPEHVNNGGNQKDEEYSKIIDQKDNAEHQQIEGRKEEVQRRMGQKFLDAVLVGNALKQVAHHSGVEIADRQLHQLG